jgi:hypothetical protein
MRTPALSLLVTGVLFLAGCGGPQMGAVRGRLTCNGQPVKEANIIFTPVPKSETDKEPGKAAAGATDADGRFSLTTFHDGDGALVGKHRVTITLDPESHTACKSKVVLREVKPGGNEMNIELNE